MRPSLSMRWRTGRGRTLGWGLAAAVLLLPIAGPSARAQAPGEPAPPAALPDPASCNGLAAQATQLPAVLGAVPKYRSTFVLVVPQRHAEQAPSAGAPGLKALEVGVQAGTAGPEVAAAVGLTRVRTYPSDASPLQPLQDLKAGTLDAAILWAPVAGLGIIDQGLSGQVSIFTLDRPRSAPAQWPASGAGLQPCAAAIADELEASGVLPAELLVSVDLRDLLTRRPPPFSLEEARQGGTRFNQSCARCHGTDAVADPKGLAPVDLRRISISRLSFAGFSYIVLNGRPQKSMPPLRGTVSEEDIALIYQYLRARSQGHL